jgi:hypothetical protein
MSRRAPTTTPEYANARKALKARQKAETSSKTEVLIDGEWKDVALHPLPERNQGQTGPVEGETSNPPAVPPTPTAPPNLGRFATREELAEAFLKYVPGSGICPLCGVKMKKLTGIYGHLSKCLRLSKSKTESTAIS